jgi:hypothetical protein
MTDIAAWFDYGEFRLRRIIARSKINVVSFRLPAFANSIADRRCASYLLVSKTPLMQGRHRRSMFLWYAGLPKKIRCPGKQ